MIQDEIKEMHKCYLYSFIKKYIADKYIYKDELGQSDMLSACQFLTELVVGRVGLYRPARAAALGMPGNLRNSSYNRIPRHATWTGATAIPTLRNYV